MRRILAIDGGGLRGVVAIAFLERIETAVRRRLGGDVRLAEIFDLVGGTSTGAIIATAIALGQSAAEIREAYFSRAEKVFRRSYDPRRITGFRPRFDAELLEAEFVQSVGNLTLDSPELRTLLAILVKRLDTGSPWIVSNIPSSPYFDDAADGSYRGNRHYRLSRLLRASTAVPSLFDPAYFEIAQGQPEGLFIDGGFSPYNDPSLALLMLARMKAYGLEWPTGPDRLCVVSLGTGALRARISRRTAQGAFPLFFAARSLVTLVLDGAAQTRMLMQWLGRPLLRHPVNSEIGDLADESLGPEPFFSYLRLDAPMEAAALAPYGIEIDEVEAQQLRSISDPAAMPTLHRIASAVAERAVTGDVVDQLLGPPPQASATPLRA